LYQSPSLLRQLTPPSPFFALTCTRYTKAHAAIRANPSPGKKSEKKVEKKRYNERALTFEQRKARVEAKKAAVLAEQEA